MNQMCCVKPFLSSQNVFSSCALMHKIIFLVDVSITITKSITPGAGVWIKYIHIEASSPQQISPHLKSGLNLGKIVCTFFTFFYIFYVCPNSGALCFFMFKYFQLTFYFGYLFFRVGFMRSRTYFL